MTDLQVFVRSQTELQGEFEKSMNDVANSRWTVPNYYEGINSALLRWGRRVLVPYEYTITGGFVTDTYEYTLPDYMDSFIRVQQKRVVGMADSNARVWEDVTAYEVYPTSTGGRTLRLEYNPFTTSARIIWYATNGPIPVSDPLPVVSAAALTNSATSVALKSAPMVGRSGYIKIDNEWMQYAGVTAGATITLTNLVRGVQGTTAASHLEDASVAWGVAVHRMDLFEQMRYEMLSYLHLVKLNNAAPTERTIYMDQFRIYKQMADEYFRGFAPIWGPRLRLTRNAIGPGIGDAPFDYTRSS